MKLFRYENFIKESKEDIDSICKKFGIRNYTINEDSTVDVDWDVNLYDKGLTKIPLKFGEVSGYFSCGDNQLISLEGSPLSVGGYFNCISNQLKSLEGSPLSVGGGFYCSYNKLKSLDGISGRISGGIYCYNNQLRDVKGVKDGWLGEFDIRRNPVYQIFKLFPIDKWDEVIEFLNEHDTIRDGNLVILQRLEQVFLDLGLKVPEIEEIKGYKIHF
jgi:hypothetical protein